MGESDTPSIEGPKILWGSILLGSFLGYFFVLPAVMIIAHIMLELQLGHGHTANDIVFIEIENAFTIQALPWGLAFIFFGGISGYIDGKARQSHNIKVKQFEEYSNLLEIEVERRTKELSDSEEKFRTIIETGSNAQVGLILLQDKEGKDGVFNFVNDYAARLFGYTREELLNMSFYELIPAQDAQWVFEMYRDIQNEEESVPHYETEIINKEGQIVPVSISSGLTVIDGKAATVAFIRDITQRKSEEESLKSSYEELKSIDEFKNNIIMNVSHELKTPITIATTHIELAVDEEDEKLRGELLLRAKNALMRQGRIVENMIEMAQGKNRKIRLNLEEINLADLVAIAVGDVKPYAVEKGIVIEQDIPDIQVKADFKELMKALSNILDNSVKFTDKGGSIKVSAREDDGTVELMIADTGIGIPKEYYDKVFEKLFQVDATATRKYGGAGMGLALAKEIVEAHGGRIWCEDNPGGGSIFKFTLPIGGIRGDG